MTIVDRDLRLEDISLENDDFAERIPHETFALLRREAPVWWYDWPLGQGYWCVTRHADVVAISRDTKTFTSEQGANLEDLDAEQQVARRSMLETDPPRHTRLRGLVGPPFTPRAIKAYELALRELTETVLDRALPLGGLDFVEEIAKQLPIRVLCQLLGAPDGDTNRLIDWATG
jgi:cytochrome P450